MFFRGARQGHNDWWLYLVGIIIVALGYFIGQIPLTAVIMAKVASGESDVDLASLAESLDFTAVGIHPVLGFALALVMFLFALLALFLVVRKMHNRPFATLIYGSGRIRWSRFFVGLAIWFSLSVIAELGWYFFHPEDYTWQFDGTSFGLLLLTALVLIPFQASFEELFIRGYLMQGIGNATNSRLVAVLASSALFTGLHMMNPEVGAFGLYTMIFYYTVVGIFLAVITLLDDGLELAMGVHTATNLYGSLVISFEGSVLQTPTLFRLENPDARMMLVMSIVAAGLFIAWGAKHYRWPSARWAFGPVRLPESADIVSQSIEDPSA